MKFLPEIIIGVSVISFAYVQIVYLPDCQNQLLPRLPGSETCEQEVSLWKFFAVTLITVGILAKLFKFRK